MLSIAIIFPLVFTIRGSFRRREKALEHLSQYRSAMKTLYYFTRTSNLTLEEKNSLEIILNDIGTKTLLRLKNPNEEIKDLDDEIENVYSFIVAQNGMISTKLKDRIFKYLNDLHEAIDNLHAIHIHRTPISLKAYCKVFIYIFPMIYTPTIIFNMGLDYNHAAVYFVVILTEFILISLYNIQDHLEYPFDNKGLDDIKLEHFKIIRK
ncbi:MAG: hypothetical protein HKP49_00090 [Maribacter sp.]|nr:hypothetical protein [Maribacter sp.]